MASKKILSGDRIMEVLFNEESEGGLIPECDSNESSDSERPGSPEIALISDVADEATPDTVPSCLPLPPFTTNTGLNTNIQNTDVVSFVTLFITYNFLVYVCEPTNVYASQVISATPHPFTKHSQFQT
jgi:hypothetical protein